MRDREKDQTEHDKTNITNLEISGEKNQEGRENTEGKIGVIWHIY